MNYLNTERNYLKFEKVLKSEIYVDKSLLIESINKIVGTNDCNICITRPRRFGKTINLNMLGAYYTIGALGRTVGTQACTIGTPGRTVGTQDNVKNLDSHKLFDNLEIEESPSYEQHMNRHNVIYIDFSRMPQFCSNHKGYIDYIYDGLIADLEEYYPSLKGESFSSIDRFLNATNDSFIFILDEWDSIFYKDFTLCAPLV